MSSRRIAPKRVRATILARFIGSLLTLLLLVSALPYTSQAVFQSTPATSTVSKHLKADFVPGEILVRFRSSTSVKSASNATMTARSADGRDIPVRIERLDNSETIEGLRLAHVAPEDTLDAIEALNKRADVIYAEPNYIWRKTDAPNDPEFPNMWALNNTGQPITDNYQSADPNLCPAPPCTFFGGASGADIKAEQAWSITTGSRSIVVGVVDEGIDINHPDLKDNIWKNPSPGAADPSITDDIHGYNFVDNNGTVFAGNGTYPKDQTDAHGTHVAGTIGATGNNGMGVVGVNWQVKLMSLKALGADGSGKTSNFIRAYIYAKKMRDLWASSGGAQGANIRVLNNSYGGPGASQAALDAIRGLNDSGILFVAAAGNNSADTEQNPQYPSSYDVPNIISVAATDRYDQLAPYSNFGKKVDLAAPGSLIISTTPNGTYDFYSGTSMATPHVAGAAALLCAANPNLTVAQLRAALIYSGDAVSSITGKTYSNRRLNLYQALQNAALSDTTPPAGAGNLTVSGVNGRAVTLNWTAPGDDGNTGQAALYEISFVDGATGAIFLLATQLPHPAGTVENATVNIPYRHTGGILVVKTIDKAGNASTAQVSVSVSLSVADPYLVTESSASALSTGGTPLNLKGDDQYQTYYLPFPFSFYGQNYGMVTLSTNGALYFSTPPQKTPPPDKPAEVGADTPSSVAFLDGQQMIAGLWDDLRTDINPTDDVYVVQPDADTIIFRWQGVTFDTQLNDSGATRGQNPINFEIELHTDGRILTRYGSGNTNVFPVVGISNGEPDAYVVTSHTEEFTYPAPVPLNLTNAPTVTFTPRTPLYSISGHITNGKPGFTQVTLSGSLSLTDGIDSNGNYIFPNLPAGGNYTVTPSYSDSITQVTFTPPSQTFNNLNANQTANFTETLVTYSISGRVTDTHGTGLAGIEIDINPTASSIKTQTDANGNYVFANLPAGQSYYVVPSSPNYDYSPSSQSVTLNKDETINFTATPFSLYSITGRVTTPDGTGVSNVSIAANGPYLPMTTTDSNGNYSLQGLRGGSSYTLLPGGGPPGMIYAFTPPSLTINNLSGNQVVNFTASPLYNIFGVITDSSIGSAVVGATVTLSGSQSETTTTDVYGNYYFTNLPSGGNYTITPSKDSYNFTPASLTFNNLSSEQQGNFTGTSPKSNRIDDPTFFVSQHYLDFLNRQPDHNGLPFWITQITSCNSDLGCIDIKRQNVSAAFFLSREFQETGFFVIKVQRAAFGHVSKDAAKRISYLQFITDSQAVGKNFINGQAGADAILDQNKTAYVQAVVTSANFIAQYPTTLSASAFVDALFTTAEVAPTSAEREAAIMAFGSGDTAGRAAALRSVAETDSVKNAEFNPAFVLLQYFGYLRRNPTDAPDTSDAGYQFWLNKLTQFNGDYIGSQMVRSFIISAEYRQRFGPP